MRTEQAVMKIEVLADAGSVAQKAAAIIAGEARPAVASRAAWGRLSRDETGAVQELAA